MATAQTLGIVPKRTDQLDEAGKTHKWDPDNPWEINEGVPPILSPTKPQRVNPGPAIGLH
jgi:hypothetical protein